jgi:hypothetical protein
VSGVGSKRATCQQFEPSCFFVYRCDRCHSEVLRPAGRQIVFCRESCRNAFRAGRRRLLRRHPSLRRWWNRDEEYAAEEDRFDGHAVGGSSARGYPPRP